MEDLFVYRTIRGTIDLGPVKDAEGRTTNERPRLVRAENDSEYICKFLDDTGSEVMDSEFGERCPMAHLESGHRTEGGRLGISKGGA